MIQLSNDVSKTISDKVKKSHKYFMDKVWPNEMFKKLVGGGELSPCELHENEIVACNDFEIGIDYYQRGNVNELNPITQQIENIKLVNTWSVRVRPNVNWLSFTIRLGKENGNASEFMKRMYASINGYARSNYIIQVHIVSDQLMSAAIVNTDMFYYFVRQNINTLDNNGKNIISRHYNIKKNDNSFLSIEWSDLIKYKVPFNFFNIDTSKSKSMYRTI
jgi:hypothetical protein